jgi:hypothetical protein
MAKGTKLPEQDVEDTKYSRKSRARGDQPGYRTDERLHSSERLRPALATKFQVALSMTFRSDNP